jgi:hypothetical protein
MELGRLLSLGRSDGKDKTYSPFRPSHHSKTGSEKTMGTHLC